MSDELKARKFEAAVGLIIECRDYVKRSFEATPGRRVLLARIEEFENGLIDAFGKPREE